MTHKERMEYLRVYNPQLYYEMGGGDDNSGGNWFWALLALAGIILIFLQWL